MSYYFFPETLDQFDRCCYFENFFSPDECQRICEQALNFPLEVAVTGLGLVSDLRKSKVRWLRVTNDTMWLYDKLSELVQRINTIRYHFDLSGFYEPFQFTEYTEPGDHYEWHQDSGNNKFSIRKLSLVVNLSDPSDYEGGQLELFQMPPVPNSMGTVVAFPSYEQHQVSPITKGLRRSLVVWVSGPPYR